MTNPEPNPYAPPQTEIYPTGMAGVLPLATPWVRLVAQIVDGLILAPVNLLLQFLVVRTLWTVDQNAVNEAAIRGDVMGAMRLATPPFYLTLMVSVIGIVALIAINWVFLQKGQTIGKKVMKLQIQHRSGEVMGAMPIITRRMLPIYAAVLVPYVGWIFALIDSLMIFRAGRNTLHDDIAASKVVQLPPVMPVA